MKNERNFYIDGKWVTPHSTKKNVADAEATPDFTKVCRTLERKRGLTRDDEKLRKFGQANGDIFRQPVAEIVLLPATCDICERQDSD